MAVRFNVSSGGWKSKQSAKVRDMKARDNALRFAFAPKVRDIKARDNALRFAFAPKVRDIKARGKREARRPW